jgi:AcrR family transcriptional regulator
MIMAKDIGNKSKILEAAMQLIKEKGVTSTSLSEIAEKAGIAKGTLHYYYPSKTDIIFELAERISSTISERFLELTRTMQHKTADRDIALKGIIREILEQGQSGILVHLLMEGGTGNIELKTKFKKLYREWSATIKEGSSRLSSAPISEDVADIILSSIMGLLFNSVVNGKNIDEDLFLHFLQNGAGI